MPIYLNIGGNARQKLVCHEVHFPVSPNMAPLGSGGGDTFGQGWAGQKNHKQVKILYSLDPSSHALPLLTPNQLLPAVQLQFTKTSPNGNEQVHHTVELGRTKVLGFEPHLRGKHGIYNAYVLELLEVSLSYAQISWTYKDGGKAFADNWH